MGRNGEVGPVVPSVVETIHAQRGRMSATAQRAGEERLVARWRASRRSRLLPAFAVAAVLALAGAGLAVFEHRAARALEYSLESCRVDRNGVIALDPDAPGGIHFSDGSGVSFSAGTHASLRRVDSHGAVVSVGGGSAHVDITHRRDAQWSFEAGPFLIDVTGTAFEFAWDPEGQELDLRMDRGFVRVSGPLSDGSLPLHSGQHLIVRVRQGETVIREHEGPDGTSPVVSEAPAVAAAAPPSAPGTVASAPPSSPSFPASAKPQGAAPEASWQGLVTSGHFDAVIRDAQRRGVDECIASSSSAELAALADAARYSSHDDVARRALLAERRRFPGSPSARDAAFLLGRLQETGQDTARAIEWYETYLREAPDGTYASDALGREMLLLQQASMGARARAAASQYLNRFAGGPYAARARALAQTAP
jgi:TolA-binding protein